MPFRLSLAVFLLITKLGAAFVTRSIYFSPASTASTTHRHVVDDSPIRFGSRATALSATSNRQQTVTAERRRALLSRRGPFFQLDRLSGTIEFGATADLVTQLETESSPDNADTIFAWLRDERNLALSIWDPNLIQEKDDSVYRLDIMTLQFVTLQLAPWVDVQMKTLTARSKSDPTRTMPVFVLQSVDFDPNLQVMPGMRISAESLGIVIHVAGELRPTLDGKGVSGSIAFSTTGELPPPLRILPDPALQAASDSINETVVKFAIESFKKGAKANYETFRRQYEEKQQQERKEREDSERGVSSSSSPVTSSAASVDQER